MRSAARKTVVLDVGDEAAAAPAPATVGVGPSRKKVGGGGLGRTWTWLVMSGAAGPEGGGGGASEVVMEAGKHEIMRRTGVPARDLRILDPILSYPSTMLGRERAIVINLEHIKAIITAHEVLLLLPPPNPKSPSSPASSALEPFIEDLRRRLRSKQPCAGDDDDDGAMSDADAEAPASTSTVLQPRSRSRSSSPPPPSNVLRNRNNPSSFPSWEQAPPHLDQKHEREGSMGGPKVLPFEFCALEVCLEAACSSLESETRDLEQEAYPALDELTSKISTLNLERVRQIKSRLVTISGRVQKVRDELEQLLDDDGDMAEMYLTDKLMGQNLDGHSSRMSLDGIDEFTSEVDPNHDFDGEEGMALSEGSTNHLLNMHGASVIGNGDSKLDYPMDDIHGTDGETTNSSNTSSSSGDSKHLDVEELEMLLEAYFVQIDGTLNKLSALREYVDDTEDYINIMLDDKQNHLLQMGVMLTTATLVLSGFIVVTGIFGMNIHIDMFTNGTLNEFLWTIGGSAFGCVFVYALVIGWCKWKRLLE